MGAAAHLTGIAAFVLVVKVRRVRRGEGVATQAVAILHHEHVLGTDLEEGSDEPVVASHIKNNKYVKKEPRGLKLEKHILYST